MGSKLLGFDLFLRLPKEYFKLLKKAENLAMIQSRHGDCAEIYLNADGQFGPVKFINMCVPDSFLMALYSCYIQNDNIKSLFNTSVRLRAPMVFLRAGMHNEAKASWLFWTQFIVTEDERGQFVTDAWSNPEDHLQMFIDLIVSDKRLKYRNFACFGNVHCLGFSGLNPLLILVKIHPELDTPPPLYIKDDYYRNYKLKFLLMSTNSHMTAGINLGFDRWVLFDNLKSSYEDFNPLQADFKEEFTIHIAGYVYKTESDHHGDVLRGIEEEGHHTTILFNQPNYYKEHQD